MPWTAKQFSSRHNKKLSGNAASSAARQATAMVKAGVPEGEAIATANKRGDKLQRHQGSAPRSTEEQMAKRRKHGLTYRQLGSEQGVAASTVHRKVKGVDMQRGFMRGGTAKD